MHTMKKSTISFSKEKVDKSVDMRPQTYKCVNKIRDNLFLQGGREGIVSELIETLE